MAWDSLNRVLRRLVYIRQDLHFPQFSNTIAFNRFSTFQPIFFKMGSQTGKLPLDIQDDTKESDSNIEATHNELYIDPVKEARLLAKLDLFLTPVIMLVYLCCFLDRSNIGASLSRPAYIFFSDQMQAMLG